MTLKVFDIFESFDLLFRLSWEESVRLSYDFNVNFIYWYNIIVNNIFCLLRVNDIKSDTYSSCGILEKEQSTIKELALYQHIIWFSGSNAYVCIQ